MYSDILSHIVTLVYFRIFAYLEPEIYSEFCLGIFGHIQNAVQHSYIENLAIFRMSAYLGPKTYSEPFLLRIIQAYSIVTLTLFFSLYSLIHMYEIFFVKVYEFS